MKKFVQKKKMDFKFRGTGQGHRLDEERPRPSSNAAAMVEERTVPSTSSGAAGQAALARLEGGGSVRERSKRHSHSTQSKNTEKIVTKKLDQATASTGIERLTVCGSSIVRLVCPVCKRSIPHSDIHEHMNACLQEAYIQEPLSTSVQMVHTLCKDSNKRNNCIETLCKYLDNIIEHPGDEKYRKIRTGNKTFAEKVSSVSGAVLFLEAIGFQQKPLPHRESEEQFYVLPSTSDGGGCHGDGDNDASHIESEKDPVSGGGDDVSSSEVEQLTVYREMLSDSEPLKPELDRQVTLYRPSPQVTQFDLSADFYQLSVDEIRREQKLKSEMIDQSQQLRTKAMRDKDEVRAAAKYYRYALIRIRLPDGLFLQACFRPLERLQAVREAISNALDDGSLTFSLSAFGQLLNNDTETLALLGLVPSAVMNLSWTGSGPKSGHPYLNSDLLANIQHL